MKRYSNHTYTHTVPDADSRAWNHREMYEKDIHKDDPSVSVTREDNDIILFKVSKEMFINSAE